MHFFPSQNNLFREGDGVVGSGRLREHEKAETIKTNKFSQQLFIKSF